MAGIVKKNFDTPDDTYQFVHGRSLVVPVGEEEESGARSWALAGIGTRIWSRTPRAPRAVR